MFRISFLVLKLQTAVTWRNRIHNGFIIMTTKNVFFYRTIKPILTYV